MVWWRMHLGLLAFIRGTLERTWMNSWSPKFQISFSGSLINESIIILIYRNRSLQRCVCFSCLQRKRNIIDFISYIIFSNFEIRLLRWIIDVRVQAYEKKIQKYMQHVRNRLWCFAL